MLRSGQTMGQSLVPPDPVPPSDPPWLPSSSSQPPSRISLQAMPSTPPPPSSYSFPQSPPPAASRRSYSPPSGGGVSSPLLANANAPLSSPPPLINLSPSPPRTRHEARSLLLPETSSDSSFESQERRRASSAEEGGGGSGGGGSRASNGSDEDGAATRLDSTGSSTGAPTLSSFSKEDFNPGPTSASNRNSAITFSKVEAPWMADQQRANRMSGMSVSPERPELKILPDVADPAVISIPPSDASLAVCSTRLPKVLSPLLPYLKGSTHLAPSDVTRRRSTSERVS